MRVNLGFIQEIDQSMRVIRVMTLVLYKINTNCNLKNSHLQESVHIYAIILDVQRLLLNRDN